MKNWREWKDSASIEEVREAFMNGYADVANFSGWKAVQMAMAGAKAGTRIKLVGKRGCHIFTKMDSLTWAFEHYKNPNAEGEPAKLGFMVDYKATDDIAKCGKACWTVEISSKTR